MRTAASTLAVLIAATIPSPAAAGWRDTEWGEPLSHDAPAKYSEIAVAGFPMQVFYNLDDDDALVEVQLSAAAPLDDCGSIRDKLVETYGAPLSGYKMGDIAVSTWIDREHENRIELMDSPQLGSGFCRVSYTAAPMPNTGNGF